MSSDARPEPAAGETVAVTPTLFLGRIEAAGCRDRLVPVVTAWDAVTVIKSGHQALLSAGAWDEAAAVLRLFGADEEWIKFKLEMSGRPTTEQRGSPA